MNETCPTCGAQSPRDQRAVTTKAGVAYLCSDEYHDAAFVTATDTAGGAQPSQALSRWADSAMYRSEPLKAEGGPSVTLLNATPDPLGSLAALCAMYEGRVVRSLAEVSDDARRQAFADMGSTALSGPLEVAQFHFLVEGVTRSFTHQMVRERQAFFAQESMRFAVVDGQPWSERVAYPPSLAREPGPYKSWDMLKAEEQAYILARDNWDDAVERAERNYTRLIEAGIPAEDARGLMPHAMTTRLHWVLDLRGLLHVAGLRLCTQAQFEWRQVMAGVVKALRDACWDSDPGGPMTQILGRAGAREVDWQFRLIAEQLRPVCYQQGRCGFMAKFDRGCTIRERVEDFARVGVPSDRWQHAAFDGDPRDPETRKLLPIRPAEWAADPTAARRG
jgi:flavin-dependent thymidylate synthase